MATRKAKTALRQVGLLKSAAAREAQKFQSLGGPNSSCGPEEPLLPVWDSATWENVIILHCHQRQQQYHDHHPKELIKLLPVSDMLLVQYKHQGRSPSSPGLPLCFFLNPICHSVSEFMVPVCAGMHFCSLWASAQEILWPIHSFCLTTLSCTVIHNPKGDSIQNSTGT